jgi:hypothetical protein
MADRYFVPGGSNQLSSTSNWSTTRWGATGSTVPGGSDNAYLLDGTGELSATGIDTLGAAAINNIVFGPKFAMTAPAGQVISVQCDGEVLVESVSQNLPLAMVTTVASLIVRPRAGLVTLSGAGTVTAAYLLGGNVNLMSTFAPTAMYCGGKNLNVWAEYSATLFTACEFYMGRLTSQRGFTTLTQAGDMRTTRVSIGSDSAAVAMTTWNLHGGFARFASNGTVATLNARSGLWTPSGAPGNPTISQLNYYGSNDNVNVVSKVGNVEVTVSATTYFGDGMVVPDNGQFASVMGE